MNKDIFAHYTTGLKEFDGAHLSIFGKIDQLKTLCDDSAVGVTESLLSEMKEHFREEEADMTEMNYSHFESHAYDHSTIISKLEKLLKYSSGNKAICHSMSDFEAAYKNHIDVYDLQFTNWLIEQK
jgi:hemerythrin-like metal-binding protein